MQAHLARQRDNPKVAVYSRKDRERGHRLRPRRPSSKNFGSQKLPPCERARTQSSRYGADRPTFDSRHVRGNHRHARVFFSLPPFDPAPRKLFPRRNTPCQSHSRRRHRRKRWLCWARGEIDRRCETEAGARANVTYNQPLYRFRARAPKWQWENFRPILGTGRMPINTDMDAIYIGVYGGRTNRELITWRLFGTYKRECEDGCTSLYIRFWKWRFSCWLSPFFGTVFFSFSSLSSFLWKELASKFVVQCLGNYGRVIVARTINYIPWFLFTLFFFFFILYRVFSWNLFFIFLGSNEVIVQCFWIIGNY